MTAARAATLSSQESAREQAIDEQADRHPGIERDERADAVVRADLGRHEQAEEAAEATDRAEEDERDRERGRGDDERRIARPSFRGRRNDGPDEKQEPDRRDETKARRRVLRLRREARPPLERRPPREGRERMVRHRAQQLPNLEAVDLRLGRGLVRNHKRLVVRAPRAQAWREIHRGGDDEDGGQSERATRRWAPGVADEGRQRGDQQHDRAEKRVVDVVEAHERRSDGERDAGDPAFGPAVGRDEQRGDRGNRHQVDRQAEVLDVARERVGRERKEDAAEGRHGPRDARRGEGRRSRRATTPRRAASR